MFLIQALREIWTQQRTSGAAADIAAARTVLM